MKRIYLGDQNHLIVRAHHFILKQEVQFFGTARAILCRVLAQPEVAHTVAAAPKNQTTRHPGANCRIVICSIFSDSIRMQFDVASMLQWLSQYAYEPWIVYTAIIVLMTASSFGLPIPEEITLVSVGLLAYLAKNPEKFPPPYPGAEPVTVEALMLVTFFAVFLSDFLVFCIGKFGGKRLKQSTRWKRFFRSRAFRKAEVYAKHYGPIMSGVFRFTPGLRFPGHLICGMMGVKAWQFTLVDGTAALLSVPTQVWFVATYGEEILGAFKQFKIAILSVLAVALLVYFARRFFLRRAAD